MDWIEFESFRFVCPYFADVFVRREAAQSFQPSSIIVCSEKVIEVSAQLLMVVVVEAFHRRVFNCSVHSFNLPVRPWVAYFRLTVIDPVFFAAHAEHMGTASSCQPFPISRGQNELDAVCSGKRSPGSFAYPPNSVSTVWIL